LWLLLVAGKKADAQTQNRAGQGRAEPDR
jgi:hypothetical protein